MEETTPPPFDPMRLTFFDEDEEHWAEMEQAERQKQEHANPLQKSPYSHPNDTNMQIYHEPRHYGYQAGVLGQIEIPWFDKEPANTADQNRGKYALGELGLPQKLTSISPKPIHENQTQENKNITINIWRRNLRPFSTTVRTHLSY